MLAERGVFYHDGGDAGTGEFFGRDDASGGVTGLLGGWAVFARGEDGAGAVDKHLQEEQDGLEEADGQEGRAFDDDQAPAWTQDTRDLGDGVGVVDVFRGEGADDVVERVG